ncbi:MAG: hypothetical protein BWY45_03367 [Euryarchaeota archaeon ADurb.Bin294]|nr:MAG: hypothetical protein BWY45_03367 [Euryarchaeota archaeon ADurb.Bin294]
MKVKISGTIEFETEEQYEEFLEYVQSQEKHLKAYKDKGMRDRIAQAIAFNLSMSSHLHHPPLFSFEEVEKLEVIEE